MDLYQEMKSRGRKKPQRLRIDVILDQLPEDQRESLLAALADIGIPHVRISEVMSEQGYGISPNAVSNYRRVTGHG